MSNGTVFLVLLFHFGNLLVDLVSTWEKNRDTPRHPRSGRDKTHLDKFLRPFVG